jgi:hypothetical protein
MRLYRPLLVVRPAELRAGASSVSILVASCMEAEPHCAQMAKEIRGLTNFIKEIRECLCTSHLHLV